MMRKKIAKSILIVILVIVIVALLSVLQYAIHYIEHPVKTERSVTGTGYLIWGDGEDAYEMVSVKLEGEDLHYLYRNYFDGAAIKELSVNNHAVIEDDYIQIVFSPNDEEKGGIFNINENSAESFLYIYVNKHMETVLFGIKDVSAIIDSRTDLAGKKAVLVLPTEHLEEAYDKICNVASKEEWIDERLSQDGFEWILQK